MLKQPSVEFCQVPLKKNRQDTSHWTGSFVSFVLLTEFSIATSMWVCALNFRCKLKGRYGTKLLRQAFTLKSYLSDPSRFVHGDNESSAPTMEHHGVPQGSGLGHLIHFRLRILIRKRSMNFHCDADDNQWSLSMEPDQTHQLLELQACPKDIRAWTSRNFLHLNSDKTGLAPYYLNELINPSLNQRAQNKGLLVVPRVSKRRIKGRAFRHHFLVPAPS